MYSTTCEGVMTRLSEIENRSSTTAHRTVVLNAAINLARAMEKAQRIMRNKLNLDNATSFDHGTRMAILMFDNEGKRRLPKPTTAECEANRLHNWMDCVRSSGEKTSIKTNLSEVTAQTGKVSEVREVVRAIPTVKFATDVCLTKMSLGMTYIAAKLTCETYAEIQACNITYDGWYQRLREMKIADVAEELDLTTDQFTLCLGIGWSPDVIRVELGLDESVIINLSETIGETSITDVLTLMLAFGQQKFAAGPMMILAGLVVECSLERFF